MMQPLIPGRGFRELREVESAIARERLAGPSGSRLGRLGQRPRRALVAVAAAAGLAALTLPWLLRDELLQSVMGAGALMVMLLLNIPLFLATRLLAERPSEVADERSRSVRDHASWIAHRITPFPLLLAGLALMLAAGDDGLTITSAQAYLPAALAFVQMALPTWVVAWTEPDAPADEAAGVERDTRAVPAYPWSLTLLMGVVFAAFQLFFYYRDGWDPLPDVMGAILTGAFFAFWMRFVLTWVRRRL